MDQKKKKRWHQIPCRIRRMMVCHSDHLSFYNISLKVLVYFSIHQYTNCEYTSTAQSSLSDSASKVKLQSNQGALFSTLKPNYLQPHSSYKDQQHWLTTDLFIYIYSVHIHLQCFMYYILETFFHVILLGSFLFNSINWQYSYKHPC